MKFNPFNTLNFDSLSQDEYKTQTVINWSGSPCGSNYSNQKYGSHEYFKQIEIHRYGTHPWIKETITSFDINGRKVLEIGFGMGTDHLNLFRRGATVYGIDLTHRNIDIALNRFKQEGYKSKLINGDAENLPFSDNSIDFVYSFGVIHHSPDTARIISEIHRVLTKGGKCWISVYHKNSIFFWWTTYLINYIIKKGSKKRTLQQQLSIIEHPNTNSNMVIRLYGRRGFERLFSRFSQRRSYIRHLIPEDIAYFSKFVAPRKNIIRLLDLIGKKFGWYVIVEAVK